MSDSIAIDIDDREFMAALEETAEELVEADRRSVMSNARRQIYVAVKYTPIRTGNLRSAFTVPWRRLGFSGRPMTKLDPGEKTAEYTDHRHNRAERRIGDFYSRGVIEVRLRDRNPQIEYAIYAAEYRFKNASLRKTLSYLRKNGMLGRENARKIRDMITGGQSEEAVIQAITNIIGRSIRGRAWLVDNGEWRPYHGYYAGNRRLVTPGEFQFSYHTHPLRKHSAKK